MATGRFRPKRSCRDALRRVDELVKAGYVDVVDADDFVILCRTREDAEAALALIQDWVSEVGLTLHPSKTRIVDSRTETFTFLGYDFRGIKHWPQR
ncbi:MAG: hypothetical protein RLY70_778 [Planctomycetota bacterium]